MTASQAILPGDKVAIWKDGVFLHPLIYVGNSLFVEKAKSGMIQFRHWVSLQSQPVQLMQRPAPHQAAAVVQRAVARIGREPYDAVNANCQHFANEVMTGERKSEQVEAITGIALAALVIAAIGVLVSG